jgi:protein-tyrosine-phosphatase
LNWRFLLSKNFTFAVFSYFCGVIIKGVKILVLTETDACCGPMAAAFLRDYSPALEVVSAGMNTLESVDSMVVTAMKECLIDLSGYVPKAVSELDMTTFDQVYECPDLSCPALMEECRVLRDQIKNETYLFFKQLQLSTLNFTLLTLNRL